MERAGKSLGKLKFSDQISTGELTCSAWPVAVGKRIARHATAVTLVRDRLVVEVDDAIWQKQLFHLRHAILKRLQDVIGDELVKELEFRIAVQRRPVEAAVTVAPSGDEADSIADPVFRLLYRQARKKATA